MTITDLGNGCSLYSRDEWAAGSNPGVPSTTSRRLADVTDFFVSRSQGIRLGDTATAQWLRNIASYHCGNGYSDIAFEFAVDLTGNVYECRPPHEWSAMTPGYNFHGVTCMALWPYNNPTSIPSTITVALRKCYQLLATRITAAGGRGDQLAGRSLRDVVTTDAPGALLATWVEQGHLGDTF